MYSLIFLGKEPYWLEHHLFFFFGTPQSIEAPLWTPNCKIKTNVLPYGSPFQCIRHGSWSFGEWYGIKLGCYWEHLKEWLGEQLGNEKKRQKNPSLISVAQPSHWLHETFISKTVCFIIFGFFLFFLWWVHQWGPSSTNKSLQMYPNNQHNRYPLYLSHFSFGWRNFCQKRK
jgi:hypothetical protein